MISDELLMGYLDGQLDAQKARDVESLLVSDDAARARLDQLEALDRKTRSAFDELLEAPSPRLVELVRNSNLSGEGAAAGHGKIAHLTPISGGRSGAVARAWRQTPSWVGFAIAAQVTVLFAGAALFQVLPARQEAPAASYQALASGPQAAAVNLMVMWNPETPEKRLREDMALVGARIVGGPTASGAYLLHVSPQERAGALDKLRHRQDIVLAEPVDAARGQP